MKGKKLLFTLTILCATFSQKAFAVLPPLWQDVREIKAILESPELKEYLNSADQIQGIRKEGTTYIVEGSQHSCIVEVVYLPQENLGPAKFKLLFNQAEAETSF